MRGLSRPFLDALKSGPLLERVHADATLDLQIRDEYVNVYYRGGNLLRWAPSGGAFDAKYARGQTLELPASRDLAGWVAAFPRLKELIDLFPKNNDEREVQQQIVRANNYGSVARPTDYFVCDIEYAGEHGRFDLVLVEWSGKVRKRTTGHRLVLCELKHGQGSMTGSAGLQAHMRQADRFCSEPARVEALKVEMMLLFNQKRELGILDCAKDLEGFSDAKPRFLILVANDNPRSSVKWREIQAALPLEHVEPVIGGGLGGALYRGLVIFPAFPP
ncbi:MAG: hypothetical protein GY884_28750 [Proteobacteria bacterium]|nr:hypothetical protein [Pseudomonadota bacterium]